MLFQHLFKLKANFLRSSSFIVTKKNQAQEKEEDEEQQQEQLRQTPHKKCLSLSIKEC